MSITTLLSRLGLLFVMALALVALIAPFSFLKPVHKPKTKIIHIKPDIKNLPKTEVKVIRELPLHEQALPDFGKFRDVKAKKRAFFSYMRPAIIRENNAILEVRTQIQAIALKLASEQELSFEENLLITELAKTYLVKASVPTQDKVVELLERIDIVPLELVLVQAANESAWGTSRFAKIGLNFFGIWCYRKGCGMVPNGRNHGARHEVAAFKTLDASVKRYLYNINTNRAYNVFRRIRSDLRAENLALDPSMLATGLIRYSERRNAYVEDIMRMLRHNKAYFYQ